MTSPITLTYKHVDTLPIQVDAFFPVVPPNPNQSIKSPIPAVVYFHGGGLTVGTKESWFPHWLKGSTIVD